MTETQLLTVPLGGDASEPSPVLGRVLSGLLYTVDAVFLVALAVYGVVGSIAYGEVRFGLLCLLFGVLFVVLIARTRSRLALLGVSIATVVVCSILTVLSWIDMLL